MTKKMKQRTFKIAKVLLVVMMLYTWFAIPLNVLAEERQTIDTSVIQNDTSYQVSGVVSGSYDDTDYYIAKATLKILTDDGLTTINQTDYQVQTNLATLKQVNFSFDKVENTSGDYTFEIELYNVGQNQSLVVGKSDDALQAYINDNSLEAIKDSTVLTVSNDLKEEVNEEQSESTNKGDVPEPVNTPEVDTNGETPTVEQKGETSSETGEQPVITDRDIVVTPGGSHVVGGDDEGNPTVTPDISDVTLVTNFSNNSNLNNLGNDCYYLPINENVVFNYEIMPSVEVDNATYQVTIKEISDIVIDGKSGEINLTLFSPSTYTLVFTMQVDNEVIATKEVTILYGEETAEYFFDVMTKYTVEEIDALIDAYNLLEDKTILPDDWMEMAIRQRVTLQLANKIYVSNNCVIIDGHLDIATSVSDVKMLIADDTLETFIYDNDGRQLTEDDTVSNGMKIVVNNVEYTLIVRGDVNSDGFVTVSDVQLIVAELARIENGTPTFTDAQKMAADIMIDGDLTIADVTYLATVTNQPIPDTIFKTDASTVRVGDDFQISLMKPSATNLHQIIGEIDYLKNNVDVIDYVDVYGIDIEGNARKYSDAKCQFQLVTGYSSNQVFYEISNLDNLTNDSNIEFIVVTFHLKAKMMGETEIVFGNTSFIYDDVIESVSANILLVDIDKKSEPVNPENPSQDVTDKIDKADNGSEPVVTTGQPTVNYVVSKNYQSTSYSNDTTDKVEEVTPDKKEDSDQKEKVTKDDKKATEKEEQDEKEEKEGSEKVIIIILIVLVIIGLLYLIFKKDNDDSEHRNNSKRN